MPSDRTAAPHDGLRRVDDLATLRALTHPVRIALIELIGIDGPMTATEAGARLGETPGNCSFHLRQLARYGFVEEAGGGKGRARPWRITRLGMNISRGDDPDPETEIAAGALVDLIQSRQLARLEGWRRTQGSYPNPWQHASISSQTIAWVTAEELKDINQRVVELLMSLDRARLTDPSRRPEGARPVELLVYGYPITLPPPAETE